MKKLTLLLPSLLFVTAFTVPAHAGILVEPILGYETGAYTSSVSSASGGTIKGTDLGFRLGVENDLGFIAVDGRFGQLTDTPSFAPSANPDLGSSASVTAQSLGGTLGLNLILGLRAWIGYDFLNSMAYSPASTSQYNSFTYTGNIVKLGVGYTILPLVSVNLEYLSYGFSDVKWKGGTLDGQQQSVSTSSLGDINRKQSTFLLSLSVPLEL